MEKQDIAAECMGVKVPHSPFLNETRIERINEARYEGQEIAGALDVVGPDDCVMEMGSGLGIVGAVTVRNAKPKKLVSFEANPNLLPHINKLYKINGLEDRIEVRNQVVISDPDRPQTVQFHIANSYLGSSLSARRSKETVSIPTAAFDEIRKDLQPTVLLMDIEGGELDFLRHADLEGIRAIVIEFHPNVYGRDGMIECKDRLRDLGFERIADKSSRLVWAATRENAAPGIGQIAAAPAAPEVPDIGPPRPDGGWSEQIVTVDRAIVVPPIENTLVQASGVLYADGTPCPEGALWRNQRALTTAPVRPKGRLKQLKGKWLWGGVLWLNFAHFIAESTTRMWALQQIDQSEFDGILFIPKRPHNKDTIHPYQTEFLELMGAKIPIVATGDAVRVEKLIVPGQGFALGAANTGTASYRKGIHDDFAQSIAPKGSNRLYISRSALGSNRGALIGEKQLEDRLAAEGYEIYHPQKHPIQDQIARYKAADQVLAAEGSALHVFAFVARKDQKLGVIIRRESGATHHIAAHLTGLSGQEPFLYKTLSKSWKPKGSTRQRLHLGQLDLPELQAQLLNDGFIEDTSPWTALDDTEVAEVVSDRFEPV